MDCRMLACRRAASMELPMPVVVVVERACDLPETSDNMRRFVGAHKTFPGRCKKIRSTMPNS